MKNLFLFIAAIFLFSSCDKDDTNASDTMATGQLLLITEQQGDDLGYSPDYKSIGTPLSNKSITVWYDKAQHEIEDCCWFTPEWVFKETVRTDSEGFFTFQKNTENNYDSRYKVTFENSDFYDIPMQKSDDIKFGVAAYAKTKLTITIVDHEPSTQDKFSLTINTYKEPFEYSPIKFTDAEKTVSEDKITYKKTIQTYQDFNGVINLKVNGSSYSSIKHFTGSASNPNPLEINYEE